MSQTALNLTAVAIFSMTMSALLGPIFNVSPTIPAIATFGILGIATLDSFSLQGKGSSLLLDWFARFSPQHRDRIARHEAGHFLVAHLLGIRVTSYALSAWEALQQKQPGLGGVSFDDTEIAAQLNQGTISAQLLDRYCTIWMAGIAAETLVYDRAEGGADDCQHLKAVLSSLGFSDASIELKQRFCTLQARNLLQQNSGAYEALITAMQQHADIAECHYLIDSFSG